MLSDDKIYLRKLEITDLDRTLEWINNPEIFLIMGVKAPTTKSAQLRWFEELDKSNEKIVFAICLKENNNHIGNVSLDTIDYRHRNGRISIFLADPTVRGIGIGTRALKLLIEYAFNYLNLHKLYCKMTATKTDVLDYYKKLGFEV